MKNFYYFILFIFISSCNSFKAVNDNQQEYLLHLKRIEIFVKDEQIDVALDTIFPSIEYLEDKTKHKSSVIQNFDPFPFPTKKDYKKWRKRYRKNQDSL